MMTHRNPLPPEPMRGHWIDVLDHLPDTEINVLLYDLATGEVVEAFVGADNKWWHAHKPRRIKEPYCWADIPTPQIADLHPSLRDLFRVAPPACAAALN